ncbi:MAG: hypothetical protein RL414_1245 [Actinomycetota bacterium]
MLIDSFLDDLEDLVLAWGQTVLVCGAVWEFFYAHGIRVGDV